MVNTRLKVGEYEAYVVIENQEAEHYGIEVNEATKVATCWIASTAGKHFGVQVAKHHRRFDCIAWLYLDGSRMRRTTLHKTNKKQKLLEHVSVGGNSVRPFLFGVLQLTDDESLLTAESYEELGTIEVKIYRITDYKYDSRTGTSTVEKDPQVSDKIHELAKKSVTHRVLFGQIVTKPRGSSTCTQQEMVANFVFRYRSLDMLKAHGIVPCDPPPTPTISSRPVPRKRKASMTQAEEKCAVEIDEEDEEDRTKEAQLEAELERLRKARMRRQAKKVKREPKPEPVFIPGEVIDLTN